MSVSELGLEAQVVIPNAVVNITKAAAILAAKRCLRLDFLPSKDTVSKLY